MEFARAGFAVTGVDRSGEMIARAKDRVGQLPGRISSQVTLVEGDAANYRPTAKYDAVVSLFHVVSYQTSNDALAGIFRTAQSALSAGGLFVFDFWHGSAVLTQQPTVRIKKVANSDIHSQELPSRNANSTETLSTCGIQLLQLISETLVPSK